MEWWSPQRQVCQEPGAVTGVGKRGFCKVIKDRRSDHPVGSKSESNLQETESNSCKSNLQETEEDTDTEGM